MLWVVQHVPSLVFVLCFGACVGSFLNVVLYRIPAGMSVIAPPSRCPVCGHRLSFFRENLPILGWWLVRGRCRACGVRVSPAYMLVEVAVALLFVGLYALLYLAPGTGGLGEIGGPWWRLNTFYLSWPAFLTIAVAIVALVAMTVIDARTFTIPIQIPLFATIWAFVAWPLQAMLPARAPGAQPWPMPVVGWSWSLGAFGGVAGVLVGVALLRLGVLRYSFADYDDYCAEGETLGDYPHGRREVLRELLFLLPCLLGFAIGFAIGAGLEGAPTGVTSALGGVALGYLVGGGVVWATRIGGTLAFGREAMGLGDVHLLAAVGAAFGWIVPLIAFFVAPFTGLAWILGGAIFGRFLGSARRELPYGPHLALATLVVWLLLPWLLRAGALWLGIPAAA